MVLDPADTYLVFTIQQRHFAVKIDAVAGVATFDAPEAARLREYGIFEWQGFYCTAMNFGGVQHAPQPGDTAIVMELAEGRKVVACEPATTSRQFNRKLALPKGLSQRYPMVREAFWDGARLVHCLDFDRLAA
jgi:hypothetical protein